MYQFFFWHIRKISRTENGICSVDFDDYICTGMPILSVNMQMNGQDLLGAHLTALQSILQ